MRFVGLDLLAVLLERDRQTVTDQVLVGDRAPLALEIAFGDDDLVANLEMRHDLILARSASGAECEGADTRVAGCRDDD